MVGSTTIVLHAPQEREIESVTEVWQMAMEPGTKLPGFSCFVSVYHFLFDLTNIELFSMTAFLLYATLVITSAVILIFHFIPQYGETHIMVYIGVCSLLGSLSVRMLRSS